MGFMSRFPGGSGVKVPEVEELWTTEEQAGWISCVAVDREENVYTAVVDPPIRKYDPFGKEVWCFTGHTSGCGGVGCDPADGSVRSGGQDRTVRKIASDGIEVWSAPVNFNPDKLVVTGTFTYAGGTTGYCKLSSAGELLLAGTGSNQEMAVDANGRIYTFSGAGFIIKVDGDTGEVIWREMIGARKRVESLALTTKGNIYVSKINGELVKATGEGELIWAITLPYWGDIATEDDETLYIMSINASPRLLKLDGDGAILREVEFDRDYRSWGTYRDPAGYLYLCVAGADGQYRSLSKIVMPVGVLTLQDGAVSQKLTLTNLVADDHGGYRIWGR